MSNRTLTTIETNNIKELLPQGENMLLVDNVYEITQDSIKGTKNVSITEHFFEGHFPNESMMPGVLILESMTQLANLLIISNSVSNKGHYNHLKKVVDIKFKEKVKPGDQLVINVTSIKKSNGEETFKGIVEVRNQLVTVGIFVLSKSTDSKEAIK